MVLILDTFPSENQTDEKRYHGKTRSNSSIPIICDKSNKDFDDSDYNYISSPGPTSYPSSPYNYHKKIYTPKYNKSEQSKANDSQNSFDNPKNERRNKPHLFERKPSNSAIQTNYFKIVTKNKITIYRHSVSWDPVENSIKIRKIIWNKLIDYLQTKYPDYVFVSDESAIIFSPRQIPITEVFITGYEVRKKETIYTLQVEFNKSLEISSDEKCDVDVEDVKTALEIIFKYSVEDVIRHGSTSLSVKDLIPVGINPQNKEYFSIANGWRQKVFPSPLTGLYLNLDFTASLVVEQSSLEHFIQKITKRDSVESIFYNEETVKHVVNILRCLKVRCTHNNMVKKIHGFADKTADNHVFKWNNNDIEVFSSVSDYFKTRYSIQLLKSHLPLVQLAPPSKNIFVPMEVLEIDQIQRLMRHEEDINRVLTRYTVVSPKIRFKNTISMVSRSLQLDQDNVINKFGISVINQMINVQESFIDPPRLIFETGIPKEKIDQNECFFHSSKCLIGVYYFIGSYNEIENFMNNLLEQAGFKGLKIRYSGNPVPLQKYFLNDPFKIYDSIENVDLVMLIVPDYLSSTQYGNLKSFFDLKMGIRSQVLKKKTIKDKRTFPNIILKLNAKMGGINQNVDINQNLSQIINDKTPFMIMGADATHAMNEVKDVTSVSLASIVSSVDRNGCVYTNQVAVNKRGVDIIQNFDLITKESINRFVEATKCQPKRIIMFRDGLSEGQFKLSRQIEFENIKKAVKNFPDPPKITFICVQKRHNTRFYKSFINDDDIKAGMLICDKIICDNQTFYLLAHKSRIGTAKCGQYKIIADENNFTITQLAELAFCLCRNFSRCIMHPISIPSPVFYAHLSAFRSNYHKIFEESQKNIDIQRTKENLKKIDPKKETEIEIAFTHFAKAVERAITPHTNIKQTMYFV